MSAASKAAIAFLVIFNVIFVAAGALMLAFGIAAAAKPESLEMILSYVGGDIAGLASKSGFDLVSIILHSSVFLIVMGGVVVIIGIFGCLGACCRNVCMLVTYIVILVIIILGEAALIVFAIVYPEKFQSEVQPQMLRTLQKFDSDGIISSNGSYSLPTSPIALTWASMQFKLGCCGAYGYGDYVNVSFARLAPYPYATVSISCCKTLSSMDVPTERSDFLNLDDCLSAKPDNRNINEVNCYSQLETLLKQYGRIAIGIGAGIIGIEIILIILSIAICRTQQRRLPKRI